MDLELDFDTPEGRWRSEQILLYLMTVLTLRNFWFLLDNPDFPKLYDSGMVYLLPEQLERRPTQKQLDGLNHYLATNLGQSRGEIQHHLDLARGVEIFRDIPRIVENGGGDCDNLACWRAAEIAVAASRLGGKANVRPYLVWRTDGDRMIYHAKVLHSSDNSDEDPSIIMGMGGEEKAPQRREECRKNWERYDNMWQRGKRMMADEALTGDAEYARAAEIKAACDSFGYLPKDGVFRVGPREPEFSNATKARGLDLLGAVKSPRLLGGGGGGHGGGGYHGGGHHGGGGWRGGGMRQNWGFGGAPAYIVEADPLYLIDVDSGDYTTPYELEIVSAAPAPTAMVNLRGL